MKSTNIHIPTKLLVARSASYPGRRSYNHFPSIALSAIHTHEITS